MGRLTNTVSGNMVSFKSCAGADIKSLKCYFSPVQEGTGDPNPSNVREINGWNNISLTHCGKNLFYFDENQIKTIPNTSSINRWGYEFPIEYTDKEMVVSAIKKIEDSYNDFAINVVRYNKNDSTRAARADGLLQNSGNVSTVSFVPNVNSGGSKPALMSSYSSTSESAKTLTINKIKCYDIQCEIGSTATSYEPYRGQTISITFPNNETIYGGYIDIATGTIVKEWEYYDLGDFTWNAPNQNNVVSINNNNLPSINASIDNDTIPNMFMDSLKVVKYADLSSYIGTSTSVAGVSTGNALLIISPDIAGMTAAETKAYFTGKKWCVKLATPEIINIFTPEQLKTLMGQNNIWSTTNGQVEVEYDLHETKDIVEAKKRVLLAQPHLATVNDTIAHFNTDLTSPLKECKLNLLPIQEGSGDPNPTNIRQIKGYTNCNIFKSKKNLFNFETGKTKQEYLNNGNFRAIYHTGIISDGQQKFSVSAYPKDSNTLSNVAIHLGYCRDGIIYTYGSFISSSGDVNPRVMSLQEGDEITFDLTEDSIWSLETRNLPRYNIQIEIADETTSFESYSGTTIPISWINWNQLIIDGNFTDATKWVPGNTSYGSISISNNIGTWTCTTKPTQYYQTGIAEKDMHLEIPYNHKLLLSAQVKSSVAADVALYAIYEANTHTYPYIDSVEANTWTHIYGFVNQRESDRLITKGKVCYYPSNMSNVDVGTTLEIKNFMMFDLTQIFGAGNEPTAKDFINQFSNDYYEYDLGDSGMGVAPIIYGGYIDLINGKLIKTYHLINLGTLNYTYASNLGGGAFTATINYYGAPKAKYQWTGVCNKYPVVNGYNALTNLSQGIGYVYYYDVIVKDTSVTLDNPTLIKEAMNGVMLCYELNDPIEYQLTPQQISTFKGINNFLANNNSTIEVKYWTH